MARRRRRHSYGAVAKHGSSYRRKSHSHMLKVCVIVRRDIGASNAVQYAAEAAPCVKRGNAGLRRFIQRSATGRGRTPTAATKKALRAFASKVK